MICFDALLNVLFCWGDQMRMNAQLLLLLQFVFTVHEVSLEESTLATTELLGAYFTLYPVSMFQIFLLTWCFFAATQATSGLLKIKAQWDVYLTTRHNLPRSFDLFHPFQTRFIGFAHSTNVSGFFLSSILISTWLILLIEWQKMA